ncbi:MAG: arginine decarboxylase [Chloroflexaceae bacterium]|jgi:arginine decarboxylase|nr:arginine decarboxylase [Chloroflexaceae bacterium]
MKKEAFVQLNKQTFAEHIYSRYRRPIEGELTDFLSRRNGELYLGDQINLNELARRYGAPLEVVYTPQITAQVRRMQGWAAQAQQQAEYGGAFLYAYATKANFAAEAVQTALEAGAHYETSAAADVEIAHYLWQQGIIPHGRLICCNGSKETNYLAAMLNLRADGCSSVVPILDDLDELETLVQSELPFQFGVRERAAGNRDGTHPGNDRFGLTADEIDQAATRLAGTRHELVLYHAMIGSQIEDEGHFLATLRESVTAYCHLRQRVPTLRYFNFGGGMPTSGYALDFQFDYARFLTMLMMTIRDTCAEFDVPMPDLIGEFGRYTVATHSVYLFEVGKVKPGQPGEPDWYLLNASMMVSIPDSVLVENQQFIILPLEGWDAPTRPVRLGGRRTCDSDDVYPRPHAEPLQLPDSGAGTVLALFGIGAYQQMISGRGGAHHCLSPEPQRIIIREVNGRLVSDYVPQQDRATMMGLLGYKPAQVSEPLTLEWPQPTLEPALQPVQRMDSLALVGGSPRRRMRERPRLPRVR